MKFRSKFYPAFLFPFSIVIVNGRNHEQTEVWTEGRPEGRTDERTDEPTKTIYPFGILRMLGYNEQKQRKRQTFEEILF